MTAAKVNTALSEQSWYQDLLDDINSRLDAVEAELEAIRGDIRIRIGQNAKLFLGKEEDYVSGLYINRAKLDEQTALDQRELAHELKRIREEGKEAISKLKALVKAQ